MGGGGGRGVKRFFFLNFEMPENRSELRLSGTSEFKKITTTTTTNKQTQKKPQKKTKTNE